MGNNASSTRKLGARHAAPFRKLSQLQSNHHNLEEEFSDLILHEVKRQKQEQPHPNNQFTHDLIEDEFNELNDGLLDTDPSDVQRNILPDTASMTDIDMNDGAGETASAPLMELISDLLKVDFTRISQPASARQPKGAASRFGGLTGFTPIAGGAPAGGAQLVPVRIKWVNSTGEAVGKVSIIGSFTNWRGVIKLKPGPAGEYLTVVKLALGVHKLLYVVNKEYRVLELLPTATDQEGIFFNWFEVLDPHLLYLDGDVVQVAGEHNALLIQKKSNSLLMKVLRAAKDVEHEHLEFADDDNHYTPYHDHSLTLLLGETPSATLLVYLADIPDMFVDYNYFKNKLADYELPEPPQLPAHLNNVLLNKMSASHDATPPLYLKLGHEPKRPALRRADSSYYASNEGALHLSIPNHVILNHLMTTLIRNDVLTVACITRYLGKFVTQIMHSPADTIADRS